MLRISGIILCTLLLFTNGNAQVKIEKSRSVQQVQRKGDFSKQVQNRSYMEVQSASTLKNISISAEKKYPGAKVEKVFKNKEGVYGIVLNHSKERAIPASTRRAYGRIKENNTKLKMDRNRQLVFFDGTNRGDETNMQSDNFIPNETKLTNDTFFLGYQHIISDNYLP